MEGKKVAKNAAWIIGCKIVQSVLALVVTMLTARYLGPSNFGLLNYAASVVAFAAPLMQLGLTSTLVQELVNNKTEDGEILGTSLGLNILSGLCCILGIITFSTFANYGENETVIICALYSIQLIAQAMENIMYWFQSKLLSKYQSIISVVAYIIVSGYKIFLLMHNMSVRWFAISNSLDYFIIAVSLFFIYRKLGGRKYSFSFQTAKRLINVSKYYIIANLMVVVFAQTDKIMIKMMIGDEANGFYSSGVACAGLTSFIFNAVLDSMRPSIFEAQKHSQAAFELNVKRLYSIIFWLTLLQSIFVTLLSGPIIAFLYGSSYAPAANVLRLIIWYTTFSYFGSVRNIWLLAVKKQKYLWMINLSGALANVVLNLILIPYMGIMGAALASLITQIFTNVIIGYIIVPIRENNRLMMRSFAPAFLVEMSALVLHAFKNNKKRF